MELTTIFPSGVANLSSTLVTDNMTFNLSDDEILVGRLGPRHKALPEAVVLTIVYVILFVTGVIGNVSTCIVIARNSYMQTATNYYLFSLAISDVLTLVTGLPPELYTFWEAYPWVFGKPFCLLKTFLQEMTSSASVLTITAFTVERYVAICHPIKSQTMSTLSRAIKVIVIIWLAAAVTSVVYPIHADTFYYAYHPVTNSPISDSLQCNIRPEYFPHMKYMFQLSTFILFIAPMTVITALYLLIGLTLRRSGLGRKSTSGNQMTTPGTHAQSRKTVLKMLVAVVVAFFICWAPFHAQRLMTSFVPDTHWTPKLLKIQEVLFYISGVLYFVGSTVNPILYNMMSKKYRQAFKETLCRCCLSPEDRRKHRDNKGHLYSTDRSHTYVTMTGSHSNYYQANNLKSTSRGRSHASRTSTASKGVSPSRHNCNNFPVAPPTCSSTVSLELPTLSNNLNNASKRVTSNAYIQPVKVTSSKADYSPKESDGKGFRYSSASADASNGHECVVLLPANNGQVAPPAYDVIYAKDGSVSSSSGTPL